MGKDFHSLYAQKRSSLSTKFRYLLEVNEAIQHSLALCLSSDGSAYNYLNNFEKTHLHNVLVLEEDVLNAMTIVEECMENLFPTIIYNGSEIVHPKILILDHKVESRDARLIGWEELEIILDDISTFYKEYVLPNLS